MSRVYQQRLEQQRQLARRVGELDLMLTGLRHLATDAPFATEHDRLEAIRGMFTGAVHVRALPTSEPGAVKLEFYRLPAAPPEGPVTPSVTDNGGLA